MTDAEPMTNAKGRMSKGESSPKIRACRAFVIRHFSSLIDSSFAASSFVIVNLLRLLPRES
jgi:hypothetical protein